MRGAVIVGDQGSKKSRSHANGAVVSLERSLVVAAAGTFAQFILVRAARANGTVFAQIGRDSVFPAARADTWFFA